MAKLVFGYDKTDTGAPARRAAARPRHLPVLQGLAAEGLLLFAGPLLDVPRGEPIGSLIVLTDEGLDPYLAAEPFVTEGVWDRHEVRDYMLASNLPFRPLPGPEAAPLSGTALLAIDGTDAGALARRQGVRPAHLTRVTENARSGQLILGGALLDAGGAMVGSLAILALTPPEAFEWAAADPYVTGDVWRQVTMLPLRVAPLPYHPLPYTGQ